MKNLFFVLLRSIWFLTSAHRSVFAMQNKKLFHDCLFFFQLVSKSTVIPNSNHLPNVCIVSYQKIWNKINLILYTNFFISALIVPWKWNFLPFQEINRQTDRQTNWQEDRMGHKKTSLPKRCRILKYNCRRALLFHGSLCLSPVSVGSRSWQLVVMVPRS